MLNYKSSIWGIVLVLLVNWNAPLMATEEDPVAVGHFLNFLKRDKTLHQEALVYLEENWQDGFTMLALEVVYLQRDPAIFNPLLKILQEKTKKDYGLDFNEWYKWIWSNETIVIADYADFKAGLYKFIDPKFEEYFLGRYESDIRIDEVQWGGVIQDGIPPLRSPKMIPAIKASYLNDSDIVFGIEINGDVRAYPKRILAWHEMFVDKVGGIDVAGVYCTLCGTVILYNTTHEGINHEIGTSGFLYRSNKLMYDKATQSLWNTLWGTPVIGPLRGKGIELEKMSVVTTTWKEWKRRHPRTSVLSLSTGHQRNYGEGIAYRDYFSTDELMFQTPFDDDRLKNKEEVLALQFPEYPIGQLAISTEFLKENPIYENKLGPVNFIVFTDRTGGNRVYRTDGTKFKSYDGKETITDLEGQKWKLFENRIQSEKGKKLERLPYHRAFWFGWLAAYPKTKLIK